MKTNNRKLTKYVTCRCLVCAAGIIFFPAHALEVTGTDHDTSTIMPMYSTPETIGHSTVDTRVQTGATERIICKDGDASISCARVLSAWPNAVCTLDQNGDMLPATYNGVTYDVVARSADGPPIHEDISGGASLNNSSTPTFYWVTGRGVNTGTDSTDISITCTITVPLLPGVIMYDTVSREERSTTLTWKFRTTLSDATPTLFVGTPSHARGKIGDTLKHSFFIYRADRTPNMTMTWDVGAPCSDWSPRLKSRDGSRTLDAGHADAMDIGTVRTTYYAEFTPDRVGDYSCTGTLLFTME